ncbi:MAG: class I SAM-dependent methyltransferase [Pseudomonadota bacterium]
MERLQRWFRRRRGRKLADKIWELHRTHGRVIRIIDVGGRPEYWEHVEISGAAEVVLYNLPPDDPSVLEGLIMPKGMSLEFGDARNMSEFSDRAFDLVHSNSTIEHVGGWSDILKVAQELKRVGITGWVQTPAWEFPVEPHFRAPLVHWFAKPTRAALLRFVGKYRGAPLEDRRRHVDRVNLLSKSEVQRCFPEARLMIERFALLPKSYICVW